MIDDLTASFAGLLRTLAPYGLTQGPLQLHGFATGYAISDLDPDLFVERACREGRRLPEHDRTSLFLFAEEIVNALDLEEFQPLLEWEGQWDPAQWLAGVEAALELASAEWRERYVAPLERPALEAAALGEWIARLHRSYSEDLFLGPEFALPDYSPEELDAASIPELIEKVRELGVRTTGEVVEALVRRGAAAIPALDSLLAEGREGLTPPIDDPRFWNPIHALFVLGALEGSEAAEKLGEQLAHLDEDRMAATADYWAALFHNKGAQGRQILERLAGDEHAPPLNRATAVGTLLLLAKHDGAEALEPRIDWVVRLGQEALPPEVRPLFVSRLLDYPRERCRGMLYALVDDSIIPGPELADLEPEEQPLTRADVDEFIAAGDAEQLDEIALDPTLFYDPVELIVRVREALSKLQEGEDGEEEWAAEPHDYPPSTTYRRDTPKVGRNDPCPCGSGKKYKKCCMDR